MRKVSSGCVAKTAQNPPKEPLKSRSAVDISLLDIKMLKVLGRAMSSQAVRAGDPLPRVALFSNSPSHKIDPHEHFGKYQRSILVGVPGAFTPGCTQHHLPSYLKALPKLRQELGVEHLACVSVNDVYVMKAWHDALLESHGFDGNQSQSSAVLEMLSDPRADFVEALGLEWKGAKEVLGNTRSKRFVLLLEGAQVKSVVVEPGVGTGLTCTLAADFVEQVKKSLASDQNQHTS